MGSLPPRVIEDCNGVLRVYSDGTIFRSKDLHFNFPVVPDDGSVIWEDCQFDKKNDLYLRLYKPSSFNNPIITTTGKLPILFFIHGGGFCVGSRTWPNCHNCCMRLCSGLQALVIAPDYRLAPEHRLPAALEDAIASVMWLKRQATSGNNNPGTACSWLSSWWSCVDFDKVFIMGDSSGGNLAHHLAVHIGAGSPQLAPVRVRGYILMAPFFGGTERTNSEAEGPPETHLNLDILDRFWRLSLPDGGTADHPLANPFGPHSPSLKSVEFDPILVIVGGSEILRDRVDLYAKRLKELGKKVQYLEYQGKQHGFFTNDPYSELANQVLHEMKSFLFQNSGHK